MPSEYNESVAPNDRATTEYVGRPRSNAIANRSDIDPSTGQGEQSRETSMVPFGQQQGKRGGIDDAYGDTNGGFNANFNMSIGGMQLGFNVSSPRQSHQDRKTAFDQQFGMNFSSNNGNFGFSFYQGKSAGHQDDGQPADRANRSAGGTTYTTKHTSTQNEGGEAFSTKYKRQDAFGNKSSVKYSGDSQTGERGMRFKQSSNAGTSAMSFSKNSKTGASSMNYSTTNKHPGSSMSFSVDRQGGSTSMSFTMQSSASDLFSNLSAARSMYKSASKAQSQSKGGGSRKAIT
ncbi:MAG: hypothetical protein MJK04_36865, partial [Psychrosphaera sp.]|nr:hypothetical protein [Psychrosphaera sp.]